MEGEAPRPVARLYYESSDGWRAPLRLLPPAAGGAGEPVVLAHATGLHPDAWRLGEGLTLARALSRAGFAVYLLSHRGDVDALPPHPRAGFDFDDILGRDLPAALARIREHAGFSRIHWVGHGMGGQLGLAHAARSRGEDLASVVVLGAPARFERDAVRSEVRRLARVAGLMPAHWRLPVRSVAAAAVPWVDGTVSLAGQVEPGTASGPRLRGMLSWATDDLTAGLMRQVQRWHRTGCWSDRTGLLDYAESLADARGPLLVLVGPDDALCPPDAGLWAARCWGGDAETLVLPAGYGHLDPLVAVDAPEDVFRPIARWLTARRRRAW